MPGMSATPILSPPVAAPSQAPAAPAKPAKSGGDDQAQATASTSGSAPADQAAASAEPAPAGGDSFATVLGRNLAKGKAL